MTTAQNFTLKFGKYKGQLFFNTPTWYQNWLLSQEWFKVPTQSANNNLSNAERSFSNAYNHALKSNFSERSIDALADVERALDDAFYDERKYSGMNYKEKQAAMEDEYNEIIACNEVYNYYNN